MDCKDIQPVHAKGDQFWVFLEGLMLKLKLQYFGTSCEELTHEKTVMLGKIEGRWKRGRQRIQIHWAPRGSPHPVPPAAVAIWPLGLEGPKAQSLPGLAPERKSPGLWRSGTPLATSTVVSPCSLPAIQPQDSQHSHIEAEDFKGTHPQREPGRSCIIFHYQKSGIITCPPVLYFEAIAF